MNELYADAKDINAANIREVMNAEEFATQIIIGIHTDNAVVTADFLGSRIKQRDTARDAPHLAKIKELEEDCTEATDLLVAANQRWVDLKNETNSKIKELEEGINGYKSAHDYYAGLWQKLNNACRELLACNPVFRSKPVGQEAIATRLDQDAAIAAENRVRECIWGKQKTIPVPIHESQITELSIRDLEEAVNDLDGLECANDLVYVSKHHIWLFLEASRLLLATQAPSVDVQELKAAFENKITDGETHD